jgi:hypothetical protein
MKKLMNSEKNKISTPNDENRMKKVIPTVIVIMHRHYRPHRIFYVRI